MKRIRIQQPGGYEALRVEDGPDPQPGPGQVRVAVEACGVNYADGIIRMGLYASAKQLHGYPITPGFEVAGRIDAIGAGVTSWQVGQRVIGLCLFNGYSSSLCFDAEQVFALPEHLSMAEGASLPTVFLTAWFMVHQQLHPRAGERWLVHSAAGGVGSALVQIGRLAGCQVTGVVGRTHKIDHCTRMGADRVIDKSREDLWIEAQRAAPDGYHAIFDANGVATLRQSYAHLAPTGRLVIYGFHSMLPHDGRLNWLRLAWDWLRTPRFNPLDMTQRNRSVLAANLSFLQSEAPRLREGMRWLMSRFESGELQPLPVATFPLERAADAQRSIESGQSIGKLVLLP
ncbi:MAG: zinc-binding dehydrogenase [Xanthomonadales bacterium]|nr:zinc-binding dehydrogenase [Xanthomonadales bacterium]MBP6078464.1 zinc-binding dehydrogenase [Xanthomonadales bacterium]MBP7622666.1 zinc-binding dehydrogenase [Xanthomonadales bacterium]